MNAPSNRGPSTSVALSPEPATQILKSPKLVTLTTQNARALITPLLRPGVTYERILSEMYFVIDDNPKLLDCTPTSLVTALASAVKWDLKIGEEVFIVPYKGKAKAIRGYKGDISLICRSGAARTIDAYNVFKNEPFKYELGTNPFIEHVPIIQPSARGPWIASYAVAKLSQRDIKVFVLSAEEIDAVRKKYSQQWADAKSEDVMWYGPKTCVHRIAKQLPTTPKLAEVLRAFEAEEAILDGEAEEIEELETLHYPLRPLEEEPPILDAAPDTDWDDTQPTPPAPRARTTAERYKIPFGRTTVGKELGDIPTDTLTRAMQWVNEDHKKKVTYSVFLENATQVLEDRRNGDAPEPPAVEESIK